MDLSGILRNDMSMNDLDLAVKPGFELTPDNIEALLNFIPERQNYKNERHDHKAEAIILARYALDTDISDKIVCAILNEPEIITQLEEIYANQIDKADDIYRRLEKAQYDFKPLLESSQDIIRHRYRHAFNDLLNPLKRVIRKSGEDLENIEISFSEIQKFNLTVPEDYKAAIDYAVLMRDDNNDHSGGLYLMLAVHYGKKHPATQAVLNCKDYLKRKEEAAKHIPESDLSDLQNRAIGGTRIYQKAGEEMFHALTDIKTLVKIYSSQS